MWFSGIRITWILINKTMLDSAQPRKPLPDLRYPFLIFVILLKNIGFLVPFAGAWVHLRFLVVSWLLICLVFCIVFFVFLLPMSCLPNVAHYWLSIRFSLKVIIYSYLCNQFLSPLKVWVWIPLMPRWMRYNFMWYNFFLDTPVFSTNKPDRHDIAELCF